MTEETKKSKDAKDPNFVSVRLPDDVANWLREYATTNKLVRAGKPNMGGSIIAIVRAAMSGQTISNNVGQSIADPDVDIERIVNDAIAPLVARLEALETNRSETVAPTKKVEDSRSTELQTEIKRLNNAIAIKDNEIEHHKKEISNKTHKINDLQIEIQDYHRDQLEKDGISLPPREETILTISGNFTQKELDKAATKGAKKQSTIDYPMIENPLPDKILSDNTAAPKKPKATKRSPKSKPQARNYSLVQINRAIGLEKMKELGLEEIPKTSNEFAILYPDHFEYDAKYTKLSWKKPKA